MGNPDTDRLLVIVADVGVFLGILATLAVVLVAVCRYIGLGRCGECRQPIPPWNAYCWEHSPFKGGGDTNE